VFLREKPEKMGPLPDGAAHIRTAKPGEGIRPGLSWWETRHGWAFWVLVCAFCLSGASVQGCVVHMSAMLTDRGSTAQTAALASSVLGAALLIGRVGSGYLLDRLFAPLVAAFFFGVADMGIALLGISTVPLVGFVAAFLIGLGVGAEADLIAYMTSRYFGLRSFGETYSYAWASFVLSGALGAYLLEIGFEARGSYFLPFAPFFGMDHCSSGDGPNTFDSIRAIEQWVEEKTAPDRIIASELREGKVIRTRPLCPFPQVAEYKGVGSIDDAASFVCSLP
jgi:hypothetical protein